MTFSVNQEHLNAGGDIVGGDKSTHYNYFGNIRNRTLDELYNELEKEKDSDLKNFIDELNHYANQIDRKIFGLEAKLTDAELDNFIDIAIEFKEKFEKLLTKRQYSFVAQKIFLYFLSKARAIFQMEIKPKFPDAAPEEKFKIVREQLVDVLHSELGKNKLDIGFEEVYGMVFFLTGNCHINWK